jgi:hypothetical protein
LRAPMGGQGAPDFGRSLFRERLVSLIASKGNRPTVIVGASGSGKSVAAVQYAQTTDGATVWVDAGGTFLESAQLADMVSRAAGGMKRPSGDVSVATDSAPADIAARIVDLCGGRT